MWIAVIVNSPHGQIHPVGEAQRYLQPTLVVSCHHWEGGRVEERRWSPTVTSLFSHTTSISSFWHQSLGQRAVVGYYPLRFSIHETPLGPDRRPCSKLEPNYTAPRRQPLSNQRRNTYIAQESMRKKHPDYPNQQFLVWGGHLQKHL